MSAALLSRLPSITRASHDGYRYYEVVGSQKKYPSVTTVLNIIDKPFLLKWEKKLAFDHITEMINSKRQISKEFPDAKWFKQVFEDADNAASKKRDEASDFGTKAHAILDKIIRKEPLSSFGDPFDHQFTPIVRGFEKWRKKSPISILKGETMIVSEKWGYAGEIDAIGQAADGSLVVLDWKTSRSFQESYALQLSAYANALEELTGEKVKEGIVVKFSKTKAEFEEKHVHDLESAFKVFTAALHLWNSSQISLFKA